MYLNPEYHGPIDPTPADIAMEQFRRLFKNTQVYVYENKMIYRSGDLHVARKIIAENNLPLFVTDYNNSKGLEVRYVPGVAACQFIMKQAC